MSQFDRYTMSEYVEAMRVFLGISKKTFLKDFGFLNDMVSASVLKYTKQ